VYRPPVPPPLTPAATAAGAIAAEGPRAVAPFASVPTGPLQAAVCALLVALAVACAGVPKSSLMEHQLRNAEYLMDWAYPERIRLKDGFFWQRLTPRAAVEIRLARVGYAPGKLNGDEAVDAAVLLLGGAEGTDNYYYLAAVLNDQGKPRNVATASLGQHLDVRDLAIRDGRILMDVVSYEFAAPAQLLQPARRWVYHLQGDELVRQE
jgi:hypothetical protein